MTDPGSAISISLEDIESRIRAIAARRAALPAALEVARTEGPKDGASTAFAQQLGTAASTLSQLTRNLSVQLRGIERALAVTGQELIASDESAAGDLSSYQHILGAIATPAPAPGAVPASTTVGTPTTPGAPTTTGPSTTGPSTTPAPATTGSSDGDATVGLG